jgi:hypothetical protein
MVVRCALPPAAATRSAMSAPEGTALSSKLPRALESPVEGQPLLTRWAHHIVFDVEFRSRLLATLKAIEPVLKVEGVIVAGSEVPNLLQPDAQSTLIVSEDVDIAVPVEQHTEVKRSLTAVRGLRPSREEPSVWLPDNHDLIEVNFIGMDSSEARRGQTYVLEDSELPLLVFASLSHLRPGKPISVDGLTIPVPQPASLLLEKLVTDRSGVKGDRDLLVVLGLLLTAKRGDLDELGTLYSKLSAGERYSIRSNLTILSLLEPHHQMPDPSAHRAVVRDLLRRLEQEQSGD